MESQREVNPLHSRYIDLTARYKASWTFHRFLDGLQRFFGSNELGELAFDFPSLYKSLKKASVRLHAGSPGELERELDSVAKKLGAIVEALDEQDRRVSPSYLRLFFQRVRRYDERILIEMLRFYQEVQRDRTWDADRIDKIDFLVSRLAESVAGADLRGDRARLAKVLDRLSARVALEHADSSKVGNRVKLLAAVRTEIAQLSRFEELAARDIVGHYRRLKHSLGRLFFDRRILPSVVEANAMLSGRIRDLVRLEEERIFDEYDRISKLERDRTLDGRVLDAIASLRQQIDGFQQRVKSGTYRIDDLQRLDESLEGLRPLLAGEGLEQAVAGLEIEAAMPDGAGSGPEEPANEPTEVADLPPMVFGGAELERLLAPELAELAKEIAAADPAVSPESAVASGALLAHRLSARQVEAFRRLAEGDAPDRRLESFLVVVAALRVRLRRELDRVDARLAGEEEAAAGGALRAVELGDWCLTQFPHFGERAACGPDAATVRPLRRLRVELMRDYAELWLALYRRA